MKNLINKKRKAISYIKKAEKTLDRINEAIELKKRPCKKFNETYDIETYDIETYDDGRSRTRKKPSDNWTELKTKLAEPRDHFIGGKLLPNPEKRYGPNWAEIVFSKANPKTKNQFAAKVLRVLAANPEGMRRNDLLKELGAPPRTRVVVLSAMGEAGLITSEKGITKITKTGKSWLAEVERIK